MLMAVGGEVSLKVELKRERAAKWQRNQIDDNVHIEITKEQVLSKRTKANQESKSGKRLLIGWYDNRTATRRCQLN